MSMGNKLQLKMSMGNKLDKQLKGQLFCRIFATCNCEVL